MNWQSLLLVIFMLVILGIQWVNVSRFIADDSYFYMVTARNIAFSGEQTFSGIMPTNGVHPLWLYLLSFSSWIVSFFAPEFLYHPFSVVPLSLVVLALGAYAAWRAAGVLGLNRLLFTVIPIGFLCAFNLLGSEAYLFYCCLSLLILVSLNSNQKWFHAIAIGLAGAAVFLARLDSIFFVTAYFVWLWTTRREIKFVGLAFLVTAITGSIYVISNYFFFDGIIPISGWLKSSFPTLSTGGIIYNRLGTEFSGYNVLFGLVPIIISTAMLPFLRVEMKGHLSLVYVFWVGSVLHFLYIACFSRGGTGWLWYYVLPVVLGSFMLAIGAKQLVDIPRQKWFVTSSYLLAAFLFTGYSLRNVTREVTWEDQGATMLQYLDQNEISDAVIIVGDAAGKTAFYGNNQVMGLDMLTSNQRYVSQMMSAENGFQFVLDSARATNKEVYLLYTSGTWLGWLEHDQDYSLLSYLFLSPGSTIYEDMGTVDLGKPVSMQTNLAVWRVPDAVPTRARP